MSTVNAKCLSTANPKCPNLALALISFLVFVGLILWGTAFTQLPPALPLIGVCVSACLLGKWLGYSWKDLQQSMFDSVARVLPAIFLLILVGMLIGVWIISGTIPTFVYLSLQLISPSGFLVTAFVLCVITSVMTGTSYGTMGTMGVALLGVGTAMGFPVAMVVGAIVSGAYFGDKVSPASSSTNITAAICEVELFNHIASMLWTTIPTFIIVCAIYMLMGWHYTSTDVTTNIPLLLAALQKSFNLSYWTLLPPVAMLLCAIKRVPAIPSIVLCLVTGIAVAVFVQERPVAIIADVMIKGFVGSSGLSELDSLLNRGGANSVMNTVMLCIIAVSFGGIIEKIGILEVIVNAITHWAKSTGRLIVAVLLSGYVMLIGTGAQMCTIVIPGRAFAGVFKDRNIHARVLSRTIEDSGVIAAPLLPWGVHAFYILGVLGVSPYLYAPYAFMCWLVPFVAALFGYMGIAIWDINGNSHRTAKFNKHIEDTGVNQQLTQYKKPSPEKAEQ